VGTGPVGSPGEAEEAHMDEDMTGLLSYLGEGGAT